MNFPLSLALIVLMVGCQSQTANEAVSDIESEDNFGSDTFAFIDGDSINASSKIDSIETRWIHPDSPKRKPNPSTEKMKFDGFEFGDYAHFSFINEKKKNYDFAFGYNNLESFEFLFDETAASDNYVGKWFTITWDSLWSGYPCCEGEYDMHYSFMPSIVKIKAL